MPPADAAAWRSELASGMSFRDVWRTDVEESFDQIQRRTCKLTDWHNIRVVALPTGTTPPSCHNVKVPWVLMPDPLRTVALPDGGLSKMDEILHQMHNIVHFHWTDTSSMQNKILELAQSVQASLALKPTHESRNTASNQATRLHLLIVLHRRVVASCELRVSGCELCLA